MHDFNPHSRRTGENEMAKAPIETLFDGVKWVPTGLTSTGDELVATHEGVLTILGWDLKVYQLNDGQRVIDVDDFENFVTAIQSLTD